MSNVRCRCFFFFFNDTATTEIYTLSLHDALPIWMDSWSCWRNGSCTSMLCSSRCARMSSSSGGFERRWYRRSEEHTSELQSRLHLVCRLLLEKKNTDPPTRSDRFWHTTTPETMSR